jgi:dTDP-4-amino-4,6-dideoxygalactose transaminase
MDNLRAAILRPQLRQLDTNVTRWNKRYRILEAGLRAVPGLRVPRRAPHEEFVGSSIQFSAVGLEQSRISELVAGCADRGVELKWFGDDEPRGFTSRYDSWLYLGEQPRLPMTLSVLAKTCDLRIPLTFTEGDCESIVEIIAEEVAAITAETADGTSPPA